MPDVSKADIEALPNVNSKAPFIADLQKKGWCVVPSVIPKERCDEYVNEALGWLESFPLGFKRDDKSTWTDDHLPVSVKGGLYGRYACGHENWVWKARSEPGVIHAFQELWGAEELLVSFDGFNITFPYGEHGRTDVELTQPWPHQDQNPHLKTFQLAQGIIAITESGPQDGGLTVLEGSHHMHSRYFAENGGIDEVRRDGRPHGYHYQAEEADWYRRQGCKEVKIECPAGSVIIWDSRLIHWNQMPTGQRTRVATYACYCPRSFATPEALQRKAEIFQQRLCTSHWPALNYVPQLKYGGPMRNGKPDPHDRSRPIKEPEETETVLRLAGVMPYQ
jgi:hypothetical protein